MTANAHRADIDGLRALSIVLIFLFHLMPGSLSGGFIGVDIFFVISGYLISRNIRTAVKADSFSLVEFYAGRVRRIVPALLAMIVVTVGAGVLIFGPGDYASLSASATHAALFVSNFYFFGHTGYFDGPANTLPLLHTWSLAVEGQFYVVWPVCLLALHRLAAKWGIRPVALLIGLSALLFAVSAQAVTNDAKAAFYLAHARAWEFAVGAIAAYLPAQNCRRAVANLLPLAGLTAIFWSVFTLSPTDPFPSWNALLPVIGTALLVHPGAEASRVGKLLASGPLVLIGKMSYSIYLWHWPVIVFWRVYSNEPSASPIAMLAIVAVVGMLSFLSWVWIEQPFRRRRFPAILTAGFGTSAAALVALLAWPITVSGGLPGRLPPQAQSLASKHEMWRWPCPHEAPFPFFGKLCAVGTAWNEAETHGMIWGDSHAEHLMPFLEEVATRRKMSIALVPGCPAFVYDLGLAGYSAQHHKDCRWARDNVIRILETSPDIRIVILAAAYSIHLPALHQNGRDRLPPEKRLGAMRLALEGLLPRIDHPGRKIVIFGDIPHMAFDPVFCFMARATPHIFNACENRDEEFITRRAYDRAQFATNQMLRAISAERRNTVTIIPGDFLCDTARCISAINSELIYRDPAHLRRNLPDDLKRDLAGRMGLAEMLQVLEQGTAFAERADIKSSAK